MKKNSLLNDVYYLKDYASLYAKPEDKIIDFDFSEGQNKFYNLAIKRPITKIGQIDINDGYYDLETAYGYGGYLITTNDTNFIKKALNNYQEFCESEKIIAEFIRFHPKNNFPIVNKDKYLNFLTLDRKTVSIDLKISKEERWGRYSSRTRNKLRNCYRRLKLVETNNIDDFMKLYQSTMERNEARAFYSFNKAYYEKLLLLNAGHLFAIEFDGEIINMSFILIGNDYAHYHLSGNNDNFSKLNGNYFLFDSVCDHIKNNYPNVTELHLGGGRTNKEDDSLLIFKSLFSQNFNDFYIGGKIFNPTIFQKYKDQFSLQKLNFENKNLFLNYRMET